RGAVRARRTGQPQEGETRSSVACDTSATETKHRAEAVPSLRLFRSKFAPDVWPGARIPIRPWHWPEAIGPATPLALGLSACHSASAAGPIAQIAAPSSAAPS